MYTASIQPVPPRRHPFPLWAAVVATGTVALGLGAIYVFSTQPAPVAVTDTAGTAQFNFRVTGIPVPGVVPDVRVQARWNPSDLSNASATAKVDLTRLKTGIALRDTHAKEFLGVHAHPQATFKLQSLGGLSALKAGQQAETTARGIFTLNGVAQPLDAKATLSLDSTGHTLDVTTRFNVAFARYQIAIPGADPATDVTVKFRLSTQR